MINDRIDLAECAEQAITFLEGIKNTNLTAQEQYIIGREIQKQSGFFYEVESKMNKQ